VWLILKHGDGVGRMRGVPALREEALSATWRSSA